MHMAITALLDMGTYFVFGAFGIAGGFSVLLLPDTVGFPLPDTFQDVEEMKKKGKSIWKLYKPRNADNDLNG